MIKSIQFRNMLFLIGLTLALFAIHSVVLAQDDKPFESPLKKGAKALQFKIISDFSLDFFEGTAISAKYHLSPSRSIRVGLSFGGTYEDKTDIDRTTNSYSSYEEVKTVTNDTKTTSYSIDFLGHYTFYSNPKDRVNFFVGVGPHLGFAKEDSDLNSEYLTERTGESIDTSWVYHANEDDNIDSWEIGISSIIGLELLATQSIGFVAEYGILFDYVWGNENEYYYSEYPYLDWHRNTDDSKSTTFKLSSNGVKLGLAIYF